MNICGCLVHVRPDRAGVIRPVLEAVDGVEVHAEADDGRFVVVVEDTPARLASEIIMDLHQIPGVISLTLTYHNFEEEGTRRPLSSRSNQPAAGDQAHDNF